MLANRSFNECNATASSVALWRNCIKLCSICQIKEEDTHAGILFFYSALRAGKGRERSNRNMPVAYCCHQCKHWWLLAFLSKGQKCKRVPSGVPADSGQKQKSDHFVHQRRIIRTLSCCEKGSDYFLLGQQKTIIDLMICCGMLGLRIYACGLQVLPPFG